MRAVVAALAALAGVLAVAPAGALAADPPLTVGEGKLLTSLQCHGEIGRGAPPPIIFAPGTGSDASQVQTLGGPAFERLQRPYCAITFPDRTTADVQISVQYLVDAIRLTSQRAGQPVAVVGVSQGGLLARLAVSSWPGLREHVSDVVSVSGPQHGAPRAPRCLFVGCPPAFWQMARGSRFLRALNGGPDETPGGSIGWTTVRSTTDEIVRPATGPRPTAALDGASNIVIQDVCPGRRTTHLATTVDSVTLAAVQDALTHRGPARASRLPADVCAHPYGDGLDEAQVTRFLELAPMVADQGAAEIPMVREEPRVRPWVRRQG